MKNICVIGDSILSRECIDNLIPWPKLIFDNVDIICIPGMSSNNFISTGISTGNQIGYQNLLNTISNKYEFIIIHLGICDCWPRFVSNEVNTEYSQYVPINEFESNFNKFINKFTESKIILTSIVMPYSDLIIYKGSNYSHIVFNEIEIYNNTLEKISNGKNIFYINLNNSINKILKINDLKFSDIFNDINGHVAAKEVIENKNNRQNIINFYSEIWKHALSGIDELII
jgi:hypothetical protein